MSYSPRISSVEHTSGAKRRLMTTHEDHQSARKSLGDSVSRNGHDGLKSFQMPVKNQGICEPLDMTVQKIVKSKNESRFTTSLLSGDHSGYAVG